MWIPTSAEQVERAALTKELEETSTFDAKADLPLPKKNASLAVDVAAMATDGGVLLYGVAEDENGQPTIPRPIELAGAAERVDRIVSSSLAEVPTIIPKPLPLQDDPQRGYLLIVVPRSPRAPHQVIVGGDLRFYGRSAKGNRILGEGEIARLYERRQAWSRSRDDVLSEVISSAPVQPRGDLAYVHAFAYPVTPDASMWDRAAAGLGGRQQVLRAIFEAMASIAIVHRFAPTVGSGGAYLNRFGADAWRISTISDEAYIRGRESATDEEAGQNPTDLAEVVFTVDGRGRAFNGRGSANLGEHRVIFEELVAGTVAGLFTATTALFEAASYHGDVDLGVALTNIADAGSYFSASRFGGYSSRPYGAQAFVRTDRVSAAGLADPLARARHLLGDFFEALTGVEGYDPFVRR